MGNSESDIKIKNLELDRMVFFCDAVVAIAITLLALDLKPSAGEHEHLSFAAIRGNGHQFLAFLLSFLYISIFWTIHHKFFSQVKEIDRKLLWYNLGWLLFIVLLPFSTTLISAHFFDAPAMATYCFNTFMVTVFQNQIWDYVAVRPDYLRHPENKAGINYNRLTCNVAMINALLAVGISFFSSFGAILVLVVRLLSIYLLAKLLKKKLEL
jgi:uncharacterized membrane protein